MPARATVLVTRALPRVGLEALAARCEVREGGLDVERTRLLELADGVEAIVADPAVAVDGELLDAAGPELRVVANFAVGYDNVDLDACRERGVVVTNTPDVLTDATAELALALTMAAARQTFAAERELREGRWRGFEPEGSLGTELSGTCFGIAGLGRIGRRYAELVAPIAGEILYTSRGEKAAAERELGVVRVGLDDLLRRADVVSLHLPAARETEGLIGVAQLAAMKPTAVLVNTARGSLVDSNALAAALTGGEIAAAGLDVYEHEPDVPPALLAAPRCVLFPHIGSATRRARNAMAALVAQNVLAVLGGEEPPSRVVP
jgi:glyoxylate reductase